MAQKKLPPKQKNMFFTDHLTKEDKSVINRKLAEDTTDITHYIGVILENKLNLKVSWSDFNNSYSATVSTRDEQQPHHGTFYSAFHSSWEKAVFILYYLLQDRYHFGDWTRNRGSIDETSW